MASQLAKFQHLPSICIHHRAGKQVLHNCWGYLWRCDSGPSSGCFAGWTFSFAILDLVLCVVVVLQAAPPLKASSARTLGALVVLGLDALFTLGSRLTCLGCSFFWASLSHTSDYLLSIFCSASIVLIGASDTLTPSLSSTAVNWCMLWIILSSGVGAGVIIIWCLNSTISDILSILEFFANAVWHLLYCLRDTPLLQPSMTLMS